MPHMSDLMGSRNSALGAARAVPAVLHPGACSYLDMHLAGKLSVCKDRAATEARWEFAFPLCPGFPWCQKCLVQCWAKCRNSVAWDVLLSNPELCSLRYGFVLGLGRVSFLSFADSRDEGLYVIHWIMMAISESSDMLYQPKHTVNSFIPTDLKFKCTCGREHGQ